MNGATKIRASLRFQAVVGLLLLALMITFLVQSNRTGQKEFDRAEQDLQTLETRSLQMGGAMSLLMFELQTDFDSLTQDERDLRAAVSLIDDRESNLKQLTDDQLVLVEDFKSLQAILRNSRAILEQTFGSLREAPTALSPDTERHLHAAERAFLDFIGRRDPATAAELRQAIEVNDPALAAMEEWGVIRAHSESLIRYNEKLNELMGEFYLLPIPQAIQSYRARIGRDRADAMRRAALYRLGLFVVSILLLIFSALKAVQVGRYFRMIQRTNSELDRRVKKRTVELSEANSALLNEIRERENVEAQLRIAQKLESIGQLSAGIAHEINTPTQFVSDNVAFLGDAWGRVSEIIDDYERSVIDGDRDDARSRKIWDRCPADFLREEMPAAISDANKGLEQITSIVRAMKEFSHPHGGSLAPADLNAAIRNTITVARNEWKNVAEVDVDLDDRLPRIPCNITAINQVVLNLIVNAAQAIDENRQPGSVGRIRISTRLDEDMAEICVEDNGPGIPDAIRERIFDPFFTTKEVGKGTGQGLSIAYRIVTQMHRGSLSMSAGEQGVGSRFVVRIPLSAPSKGEGTETAAHLYEVPIAAARR